MKAKDDSRNDKSNVVLEIRPKELIALRIVNEEIQVDVLAEIEIQRKITIVFIVENVSHDKVRLML